MQDNINGSRNDQCIGRRFAKIRGLVLLVGVSMEQPKDRQRDTTSKFGNNSVISHIQKSPSADIQQLGDFVCWGTRTRTKNDRTRICSVTITPYPNTLTASRTPLFRFCGCKGRMFFSNTQRKSHFFLKKRKILGKVRIFVQIGWCFGGFRLTL